jgi:hypothetical protein
MTTKRHDDNDRTARAERFVKWLISTGKKPAEIAAELGLQDGLQKINNWKKRGLPAEIAVKIMMRYPGVNPGWFTMDSDVMLFEPAGGRISESAQAYGAAITQNADGSFTVRTQSLTSAKIAETVDLLCESQRAAVQTVSDTLASMKSGAVKNADARQGPGKAARRRG